MCPDIIEIHAQPRSCSPVNEPNRYYPAFLDLRERLCIVIGGGMVAMRKVQSLLECGAQVTVVSPVIIPELEAMDGVRICRKEYESADIADAFLVIAATDDEAVNCAVTEDTRKARIFCNVVDKTDQCSFIVPAVVDRGPIKIAISTGGLSPALAKRLRKEIGSYIGEEYETMARLLGRLRPLVLAQEGGHELHKRIFDLLVNSELLDAIRMRDHEQINEILTQALGEPVNLEDIL